MFCRVSWVKFGTTTYKPKNFVVVENKLLPKFGEIIEILVYNIKDCIFILQLYNTECFFHHYHAYEVTKTQILFSLSPKNLVDYHPLSLFPVQNIFVVPLKYHLIEDL